VPTEVGKVGAESPTFIEPVQKRKDGIEAMFSRQAKAAQHRSAVRDAPPPPPRAAAASGKRKRESSAPVEEVEEDKDKMGSSARSKAKGHPIKLDDDSEGSSDVEILSAPSSSQTQPVRPPQRMWMTRENLLFAPNPEECYSSIFKGCQTKDEERGR
jgi:hypothetical protein